MTSVDLDALAEVSPRMREAVDAEVRAALAASDAVLPRGLHRVLVEAIAIERGDGRYAAAEQLLVHYTQTMPCMRAQSHRYLELPLDWSRLPRMTRAIDAIVAFLVAADVDPRDALGAPDGDALRARSPTLATLYVRTHYGGAMPLLYGYPADLAYFESRSMDDHATIDRYLVAPIVHELCHFARDREVHLPIHLDECVGGWLGVYAHPEFAYPAPGEDDAIYGAPWLAQIGQAIARAFGIRAVVRTHAGVERALPAQFLDDVVRLARDDWHTRRSLHFLADPTDPWPWLRLVTPYITTDDPAFDAQILADAKRAMCLRTELVGGSFRTRSLTQPPAPIEILSDRVRCGDASYWIVDRAR